MTITTDRTADLLARARAAEDERDALARKVTDMQLRINRLLSGEPNSEASDLLTRQLQRARADLAAAARETITALQHQLGAAQRLLGAIADDDVEIARLRGAVEALTEQNRVLRLANRTLTREEKP